MEFRILGPLEARAGAELVALGGAKQRALLAVLLVRANQVVTDDQLIDELWDERPPPTARNMVQGYVSRLRRVLGPGELIVTRPEGYLLRVGEDGLDRTRFELLLQQARGADERMRAAGLRQALALWRGPVLADVQRTRTVVAEAARLDELRFVALEERIEADLALGRHRELLGELRSLIAAHPLRDSFRSQLMLALYRSGRQAEALEAYRETRQVLVEQLGIEPGHRLRRLERAILADDPTLDLAPAVASATLATAVPAQLPPDVEDFAGREDVLDQLDRLLGAAEAPVASPIVAVSGPAGVGKTALAVHLAHRVRRRFPDGQLWAGLDGSGPRPLDPGRVLAQFLRALGVEAARIPEDVAERASRYRTALADRSVLVVLDDAASALQVQPLLPAGAGCAVLVTSRRRLADIPGTHPMVLDVLAPAPALSLLARVAGPERVAAEPAAADRIVRLCGRLPLAIRVAGAKLATRQHWPLERLAERLADERRRLSELHVGDLDVRTTFGLAYQALEPDDRRVFRLLGLCHGPDFPAWVSAALLDADLAEAEERVERLVDARLVEVAGRPLAGRIRYRMHDLLRLFARERLEDEEPAAGREAALDRLLAVYLALTTRAAGQLESPGGIPPRHDPGLADPQLDADPEGWLATERAGLVAAVGQAAAAGRSPATWRLALALSGFFERHSLWDDWCHTHELALAAARRTADRRAEALVLLRLGDLRLDQVDWPRATALFEAALPVAREVGDRHTEALLLRGLGDIHREQTCWEQALAYYDQSLPIFQELGDRDGEARILRELGIVHREQGRIGDSVACLERCLALSSEHGDRRWDAIARRSLGLAYRSQRRYAEARACFDACLAAFGELDDRRWEAYTCTSLGLLAWSQGSLEQASHWLERALATFREFDDSSGEAYALQVLGDVRVGQGRLDEAARCLDRCRAVFRALGDQRGEAYGQHSMGLLHRHAGRHGAAVGCFRDALATFEAHHLYPWQARALGNLGRSLLALGTTARAVEAFQSALAICATLDMPEPAEVAALRQALLDPEAGLVRPASAAPARSRVRGPTRPHR